MTRGILKAAAILAALTMTAVAAPAASITIRDLTDGFPGLNSGIGVNLPHVVAGPEELTLSGLITTAVTLPQPGTRSVILLEPAGDLLEPIQSDFVTLTVDATAAFTFVFESDGAAGFLTDVAALPADTPTLLEDGTLQDVSALLNTGNFVVLVQSDLDASEVPEPGTFLMLTTGLLGCLGWLSATRPSGQKRTRERI